MSKPSVTPTPKPEDPYSLEADERNANNLIELAKGKRAGFFEKPARPASPEKAD